MRRMIFGALCLPLVAVAQEEPVIRINPSGTALYRMAVGGGGDAAKTVAADLDLTGFFQIIDSKAFPPALNAEPSDTINAANWTQVGAQGVAKVVSAGNDTQCNLFGVAQSELEFVYFGQTQRQSLRADLVLEVTMDKDKIKPGTWRAVKIDSMQCEAEICQAKMTLTYDHRMMKGIQTPFEETWILEKGNAWYVYRDRD